MLIFLSKSIFKLIINLNFKLKKMEYFSINNSDSHQIKEQFYQNKILLKTNYLFKINKSIQIYFYIIPFKKLIVIFLYFMIIFFFH